MSGHTALLQHHHPFCRSFWGRRAFLQDSVGEESGLSGCTAFLPVHTAYSRSVRGILLLPRQQIYKSGFVGQEGGLHLSSGA